MKLHSIFLFLAGVLLGIVSGVQGNPKALIEREAYLIQYIDACDVAGFKKEFSETQQKYQEQQGALVVDLSEYTRSIRNQKAAQMAQNLGQGRAIAGVKAGVQTVCALRLAYTILKGIDTSEGLEIFCKSWAGYDLLGSIFGVWWAGEYWWSNFQPVKPIALYLVSYWAYQNAYIAYYGNSILVQDIQK